MSELELQQLFAETTIFLYNKIVAKGYKFTYGETWRDPRIAVLDAKDGKGIIRSLHFERLAVDLNLYKDGKWLTNTEDHRPFGEYWKTLHPLCRWGGDFQTRPDGNHYSMEWQGRR